MGIKGLSANEIQVLPEALDAWITKDAASNMLADLIGMVFSGGDETKREVYEKEAILHKQKYEEELRVRERQAILLKAKLIQTEMEITGAALFDAARPRKKE